MEDAFISIEEILSDLYIIIIFIIYISPHIYRFISIEKSSQSFKDNIFCQCITSNIVLFLSPGKERFWTLIRNVLCGISQSTVTPKDLVPEGLVFSRWHIAESSCPPLIDIM